MGRLHIRQIVTVLWCYINVMVTLWLRIGRKDKGYIWKNKIIAKSDNVLSSEERKKINLINWKSAIYNNI